MRPVNDADLRPSQVACQRGRALLRAVPDTLQRCLSRERSAATIDVAAARCQHQEYQGVLAAHSYDLALLPPENRYPDSVFVEDAAVVVDDRIILTRPGAPSRRGEVELLEGALGAGEPLDRIRAPGQLDGGDVLQVGRRVFVGLSDRTNEAGVRQLAELVEDHGRVVVATTVTGVLHLKSAASVLDDNTVLVSIAHVDERVFYDLQVVEVPPHEHLAANVLRIPGTATVLVSGDALGTAELLAGRGFDPLPLDISEFRKADAGMTCLSILY